MIYITSAVNDADLRKSLSEAVEVPIGFGDVLIEGVSDSGNSGQIPHKVVAVGERKRATDLLACINDGRLLNQVRGAYGAYQKVDCRYFLLIEAIMRRNREGNVEYRTGPNWASTSMPWTRFQGYLNSLHYQLGVYVLWSTNVRNTAETIRGLHTYFSNVDHQSLKQFHAPTPALMYNPTLIRRVAHQLPGIGWERSLSVENHWDSVRKMINASAEEWQQIEGIGKGISNQIVEVLE